MPKPSNRISPRLYVITAVVSLGLSVVASGASFAIQVTPSPLNLDAFEGYENWPMLMPDTDRFNRGEFPDLRIRYDAQFPGPEGLGGPLVDTEMVLDVINGNFRSTPTLMIQWTSTGQSDGGLSSGSIDHLVVDRATNRLLHRIQAQPPAFGDFQWTGAYRIIGFQPDSIANMLVSERGEIQLTELDDISPDTIDFATLQFWLPFIELEAGMRFRVPVYRYPLNELDGLPVYVSGREIVLDAHGEDHDVWNVQVMSIGGGALTEFWITEDAPYFLGWDYRLAATGQRVTRMRYQSHWTFDQ